MDAAAEGQMWGVDAPSDVEINGLLCWANSVIAHAGWFRVVSAPASRTAWVMLCNSECLSPLLGRVQRLLWGDRCRGWLCHCVRSTSCLKLL